MLTKEQLNILAVFSEDIFADLTFRQMKEKSGQKSNNVTQLALKEFRDQDLIKTKKTGNVTTYSLNLDSNLALSYLSTINAAEIQKDRKTPVKILMEIQGRILKHTEFFILAVFGSYAKGKAKAGSDLDMAVIVESEETKKNVMPLLETVKRREIVRIDYHIFTRSEFLQMLSSEQENVGKQICKNNIIFYGFEQYCNLIRGRRHV
jgi:predicted nucleotidyltransferase